MSTIDKINDIRRILKSPVMNYSNKPVLYSEFTRIDSIDELDSFYSKVKNLYNDIGSMIGTMNKCMMNC